MRVDVHSVSNIVFTPLSHEVLSFIDDHWRQSSSIGTDCDQSCYIFTIRATLFVLSFSSLAANNPCFPLMSGGKATLIHCIYILWQNPRFDHKLFNKVEPALDCFGI